MSSSLLEMLSSQVLSNGLPSIARELGTDESTARKAVPAALGTLLGGLAKNTSRKSGAESLLGALTKDHDGSILDNLGGALLGSQAGPGAGILKHVFGSKRGSVESGLGQALGLDSAKIGKLLMMLAPVVLGALGKAQRQNGFDSRGLAGMLGQERKSVERNVPRGHGLVGALLDQDGDGQIADDVMKVVGSGLLKNLFRR